MRFPPTKRRKSVTLSLVDSIWSDVSFHFLDPYLDTLAIDYGAGVDVVDFVHDPERARAAINSAVTDATQQRIQELIPAGAIDNSTRLVLTNTVYMKASWDQPFRKEGTVDAPFHATTGDVAVSTMHDTRGVLYAEDPADQMIALDYDGGQISMDIVLPATGHFTEVRDELSATWLSGAIARLAPAAVSLAIPKLHYRWGTRSLREPLQALGMKDAFTDSADFSGISREGLQIADVLHQAFIDVDEKGTEAAAATAVIAERTAASVDPPKEFVADRPFLFVIRDASGAVLFVGQVNDPGRT